MDPFEILMQEHRLIERVLAAFETWAGRLPEEADDGRERLGRYVRFLREFADEAHHGKEEDILFAVMTEYGFPRQQGPIGVMLHEHDQGRDLVRTLAGLANQPAPWTRDDRNDVSRAALSFISLLRQHIRKEDDILYPMARSRLPDAARQRIGQEVERFESDPRRAAKHQALRELAASLEGR